MSLLLAAPLIMAGLQFGAGALQYGKGRKLGQAEQPLMQTPPSMTEALNMARSRASQTENPYAAMERQQLGANVSQGMDNLAMGSTSGTDILGGVTQLANQQQQGILDIGKQNIAFDQESENNLTTMLQNMANLEQKKWEVNQYQPWQQKMATASAMQGAGLQNMFGAGMSGLQGFMSANYMNKMFPDAKQPVMAKGIMDETGVGTNPNDYNQFKPDWLNFIPQKPSNPYQNFFNDYGMTIEEFNKIPR